MSLTPAELADTFNKFGVSVAPQGHYRITHPGPLARDITAHDALILAAWLVALADAQDTDFRKLLYNVRHT